MKDLRSVKEICGATGMTRQGLVRRANREGWSREEKPNPSGGGKQFFFEFDSLPDDIKTALIAQTIGCCPSILPKSICRNLDHAKNLSGKWSKATKKYRQRAEARADILKAIDAFCMEKGLKQTRGEEFFVQLYRDKAAPHIEGHVYGIEKGLSDAKVRRMRAAYKESGLVGLLPDYKRKGRSKAVTGEIRLFILKQIKAKPHIRPAHIYELVKRTFPSVPSRRTIYRFMDRWKQENRQLALMMEDPRAWKNKMMPAFGDMAASAEYFCHIVEMDSTPADIITADGKRCVLIGAIDRFSRRVKLKVSPTSRSVGVAACMREFILDWGIPSIIIKDNGKDYVSAHVEAITTALGIETPWVAPYSPEKKPFMERFFGTLSKSFEEMMAGYCGHSVNERQAIRERETWGSKILEPGGTVEIHITMEELQRAINQYVSEIYEHSPHSGLGGKTPNAVAKRTPVHPEKISDERVLDILLWPISKPRKVLKKGISIDRAWYSAPELVEHIGERVECRRDLENAGLVYVFRCKDGAFLCKASCEPLTGKRLEDYLAAKKRHTRTLKEKARALDTLNIGGNRTAMQILLEDGITPRHEDDNIIPFQTEADTPAIQEARKAVNSDTADVSEPLDIDEPLPAKQQAMDPVSGPWRETDEDRDREFEENMRWAEQQKAVNAE